MQKRWGVGQKDVIRGGKRSEGEGKRENVAGSTNSMCRGPTRGKKKKQNIFGKTPRKNLLMKVRFMIQKQQQKIEITHIQEKM